MNIFLFLHVVLNAERDGLFYAINNKINKNNRLIMKKLLLILLCLPIIGFGQTLIPDANFEQALINLGYDTGVPNGSVPTANINTVTFLDVSNNSINDLTGIEDFTALTHLTCGSNNLTNLDVSQNTALTYLHCGDNPWPYGITNLDVSNNTALTFLDCSGQSSNLISLDLNNNTALTTLICDDNHLITNFDVSGATALTYLNCRAMDLTSLDVSQNTALTYLDCSQQALSSSFVGFSLDVSNNTALTYLNCELNDLTSLDVSQNTALDTLICSSNQLTSLDLSNNTALTYLSFKLNQQPTTLDVSGATALTTLICYNSQITSLDVSNNTALTYLHCGFEQNWAHLAPNPNQITSLDVSNNTALTYFNCSNNQLTFLDLRNGNNTNMTNGWQSGMYAENNPNLFCISVDDEAWSTNAWTVANGNIDATMYFNNDCFRMTYVPDDNFENYLEMNGMGNAIVNDDSVLSINIYNVTSLDVSNNSITDLTGIEDFTALTSLTCSSNNLTNLDVSQNTALTYLNCDDNQLTNLDLRNGNNTNILTFFSTNNLSLTCILVDNAAWSTANWTVANASIDPQHYFSTNCLNLLGCTDSLALNYNPSATVDDSSCCYNCGRIEGFIYEDLDSNATYDSIVENPLGNQVVQLERSNGAIFYLTTGYNGYYSFFVDTGQQVITYSPPAFWESSNNNNQYNIDIQTDTTYSGLDFGIMPEFTKGDMTIDLTPSNTVCNTTTTLWLTVRNEGTETITNVNLDLWVDPSYSIQSASGGGTISINHIYWNLAGNFYPYVYTGEEQLFSVEVQIPAGPINSSFIDSARVTPVQLNLIEMDSTNNFVQVSNTLFCSYDPNDKQVIPKKCFYKTQDTLDYTIRFQNTGNYPATTVRLVDSLDLEKLDILSFQVLGASHDYEWSLKVPSVLEVVFDNIMLVDSSVSFNESQGFFKYRIIVRDSLPDLQPTASPAYIYFDLNSPIITNLPEVNFIDPTIPNTSSQTSCDTYTWSVNGQTYSTSGTYTDSSTNAAGCILTETLNLTINTSTSSSMSTTSCDTYFWNGNTYSTSGVYTNLSTNSNGCTHTDTLNLNINTSTFSSTITNSCDTYHWHGNTYSTSGVYTNISTNSSGCTHVDSLILIINNTSSSISNQTSCDSYAWNGNIYSTSGIYTYNTLNSDGCDSTITLNLSINPSYNSFNTLGICFGDSVNIGGSIYYNSGTYNNTFTSVNGCDSTISTTLTVFSDIYSTVSQTGSDLLVSVTGGNNPYKYFWNTGETTNQISPTQNGEYWVIVEDDNKCFSDTVYFNVNWISTFIEDLSINNLNIYPNPSKDVYNIVFNCNTKQEIDLIVYDLLGEVLYSESLMDFSGQYYRTIDMTAYSNAIYILQIGTKDGILNKKLILEK